MTKLISEMTTDEVKLARIKLRRENNATARQLGFRNWNEWTDHYEEKAAEDWDKVTRYF